MNKDLKKKSQNNVLEFFKLFGIGTVAGFINGFFGAGGGLLLVPMLSLSRKCDSKTAHATTLGSVLFMCLSSSVVYIVKKQVDFKLFLVCGIGSIIGSLIGTKLLKNLKNNIIDLVFSGVLIVAGVCMIIL